MNLKWSPLSGQNKMFLTRAWSSSEATQADLALREIFNLMWHLCYLQGSKGSFFLSSYPKWRGKGTCWKPKWLKGLGNTQLRTEQPLPSYSRLGMTCPWVLVKKHHFSDVGTYNLHCYILLEHTKWQLRPLLFSAYHHWYSSMEICINSNKRF